MPALEWLSYANQGPAFWIGLAAFGLLVGVLTGLFGVGGGFMIVPVLMNLFGVPNKLAVGSSLCFTIGTGATGLSRHLRLGNFELKSALLLGVSAVFGALAGDWLLKAIGDATGGETSPGFDLAMNGMFIVMLGLTAWLVARKPKVEKAGPSLLQRLPLGPRIGLPAAELTGVSLPGLLAVGLSVGLMKGLLGIGGGVLFMPLLILVVGLSPHQAVGTSLGVVMFSSVAGTIQKGLHGDVSLSIAMALLATSSIGVIIGAWLCQKLHATRLRRYFAILVGAVVVWLMILFVQGLREVM
jgi:hypothetical protein